MKRKRHTPEQIVRKLREGDRLLNEGKDLTEVLRHLEVSESSWNRWRAQYGGMKADEAKRLRELACFCLGRIRTYAPAANTANGTVIHNVVDLGERHLVVLVVRPRTDRAFDHFAHRVNGLALPYADAES